MGRIRNLRELAFLRLVYPDPDPSADLPAKQRLHVRFPLALNTAIPLAASGTLLAPAANYWELLYCTGP